MTPSPIIAVITNLKQFSTSNLRVKQLFHFIQVIIPLSLLSITGSQQGDGATVNSDEYTVDVRRFAHGAVSSTHPECAKLAACVNFLF